MKKNNMLRLASVLLVAVLLTTSLVSGVFAYYMSTDNTSDEARVAKWGVVIEYDNVDMFKTTYETGNETVVSSTTEDVVAPGTAGDLTGITITGTPEVDVKVEQKAELTLTGWTLPDGTEYCPIVIKVGDEEIKMTTTVAAFETAVENAIAAKSVERYEANSNLAADADDSVDVNDDVVVSWYWDFDDNDTAKDTALGNAAAGLTLNADGKWVSDGTGAAKAATIKLAITTTITQID